MDAFSIMAFVQSTAALASNGRPLTPDEEAAAIRAISLFGVFLLAFLVALLVLLFFDNIKLFFYSVQHKLFSFIGQIRARFFPHAFKKIEVQAVAESRGFLKCISRLIWEFDLGFGSSASQRHAELCKQLQHLRGGHNLMADPETANSVRHVVKEFATIIRNRLDCDEFRDAYFVDTPDYVLVGLDALWEELVENALYESPFLSLGSGNRTDGLCRNGSNNTSTSGDDRNDDVVIHGSSSSSGDR